MKYKTSLDNLAKSVTILISILFPLIIIVQLILFPYTGKIIPIFTSLVLIIIYLTAFLFRPINYILTPEKLIVQRLVKNVILDRTQIISAKLLEKEFAKGTIRTFGVGGLFGYFGKFAKFGLGSMTWYATRRDKLVLLSTTDNKKIVITPDEPELFLVNFEV